MKESINFVGNAAKQLQREGSLAEPKRAVHEGVKYPCGQCNYQTTRKRHHAEHKRAVHEGSNILVDNAAYNSLRREALEEIIGL